MHIHRTTHHHHTSGLTYRLVVEQQPIRARMCGFGDKDRRPITPPPCVRLMVCDSETGQEIDIDKVDSTFCVLQVDLWNETGDLAVNLVRHSSTSPTVSISSSTVTSYPPPPERTLFMPAPHQWHNPQAPAQYGQHHMQPMQPYGYASNPANPGYQGYTHHTPMMAIPAPQPNQHYTRNLIGMNAVNACRLNNLEGAPGFWFVLQDLSVRTEGTFRLKFSMCNIGTGQGNNGVISQGKCPILATAFSEPFTVYSAKKFPGVVESTPLSKCLAQQGIKIPIRKDGPKERGNQNEYDNDD
ncbi:hypothetical protein CC86DRAFT_442551 [Ophiobolus disseminans]|uniref:Velvet domain-containing protein n=1 Tax=Ophiobolus disseminans TaxID=1469910 RepID=A0A6A7AFW4_9PLEO|nr:hypothetical protein CC86DRAFT_442551 [Ophiobolus disseminans]